MTKATTIKAVSFATVIAVAASFGSTAFAHELSQADQNVSAVEKNHNVSKSNARSLVKALLKREYNGDRYSARAARRIGDNWVVSIKDRAKTVATASVNAKTGNIHVE